MFYQITWVLRGQKGSVNMYFKPLKHSTNDKYGGYYRTARRYEFYFRVPENSYERAQRVNQILLLTARK